MFEYRLDPDGMGVITIANSEGRLNPGALAYAFRRSRGRVLSGLRFEYEGRHGYRKWAVVTVEG